MISGTTSHKLDVVSTYSKTYPYQIGVNGVTNITIDGVQTTDGYNGNLTVNILSASTIGEIKIYYTIDNIDYTTIYAPANGFRPIPGNSNFNPQYIHPTTFITNLHGEDFNNYFPYPNLSGQTTFDIKEEAKMGMVFPPKVSDELFIDRMSVAVFERHSRLTEIKTLEDLLNYRNGYYNIIE